MRKPESAEEFRRREKRLLRRENRNSISVNRKRYRNEKAVKERENLAEGIKALKKDKQKVRPEDKRPSAEKFLSAFIYIGWTPYDKRHLIPSTYRCRSFNVQRQYLDFFKEFIYPYKIPNVLLWAAFEKEKIVDEKGRLIPSPDLTIIQSAKKWIRDIVSGKSFYKKNKGCFTRAEAHFFLNSEIAYNNPSSVIELIYYAKCMARKIGIKQSRLIAKTFARKFSNHWNHPIIHGFLDLIARSPDYLVENDGLDDICDFVSSEITKYQKAHNRQPPFSFSGRTMVSIIALANEWHAGILQEQEAQKAMNRLRQMVNRQTGGNKLLDRSHWNGISIQCSRVEDDVSIWSFNQLCEVRALLNEGRLMKSCVSSYSIRCASGESAIFHVSRVFKEDQICMDAATLEVSKSRVLVQAKGKCNATLSSNVIKTVRKWAQINRINVELCY